MPRCMTSALLPLTDFSDRLSPMVVKELRQGLRTRAFGSTMLLMHVLLILATLITGSAANTDDTRWLLDGIATLVLCLVMPFRVSNALADEVKQNTLDMLMFTRLSCSRIVFGKWASVALQSLLIALSLVPYVVARYVFGGMDLMLELGVLTLKWLSGIVIAAALVALSTIRQSWLRMVIIVVPLFFGGFGVIGMMVATVSGTTTFSTPAMSAVAWGTVCLLYLIGAAWAVFACLSLAASRISPAAAPLAWLKRGVHVSAVLASVGIAVITRQEVWLSAAYLVAAFLALDVMTEQLNEVPSAYLGFYKRGLLGRIGLPLLSPGWASGFWLTVMISALIAVAWAALGEMEVLRYHLLASCTLWMVVAIIQIFPTRRANDLLPVFLATFAVVYLIIGMFSGLGIMLAKTSSQLPWLLTLLPPAAMIGAPQISSGAERDEYLFIAMLCAAAWPLLLGFISLRSWHKLRAVRVEAQRMAA